MWWAAVDQAYEWYSIGERHRTAWLLVKTLFGAKLWRAKLAFERACEPTAQTACAAEDGEGPRARGSSCVTPPAARFRVGGSSYESLCVLCRKAAACACCGTEPARHLCQQQPHVTLLCGHMFHCRCLTERIESDPVAAVDCPTCGQLVWPDRVKLGNLTGHMGYPPARPAAAAAAVTAPPPAAVTAPSPTPSPAPAPAPTPVPVPSHAPGVLGPAPAAPARAAPATAPVRSHKPTRQLRSPGTSANILQMLEEEAPELAAKLSVQSQCHPRGLRSRRVWHSFSSGCSSRSGPSTNGVRHQRDKSVARMRESRRREMEAASAAAVAASGGTVRQRLVAFPSAAVSACQCRRCRPAPTTCLRASAPVFIPRVLAAAAAAAAVAPTCGQLR